jgi:hypothetical protein
MADSQHMLPGGKASWSERSGAFGVPQRSDERRLRPPPADLHGVVRHPNERKRGIKCLRPSSSCWIQRYTAKLA